MMIKMKSLAVISTIALLLAGIAACGPAPTAEVVKETVVVTQEVEKIVQETVVVEAEVIVTATPIPEEREQTTIIIGTTDPPVNLDPSQSYFGTDWTVFRNFSMGPLRWVPGTLDLIPGFADFPEISEDGLTFTFAIKDGVKFCDGTELTAPMYVEQLLRTVNIEGSESAGGVFTPFVESVEATDDRTIVFHLTDSYGFFNNVIIGGSYVASHPDNYPLDEFNPNPEPPLCGVGPFMVTSYDVDEQLVFEPNPYYFGDDKPKVDKLILRVFSDESTMALALEKGEIDIVWQELNPDNRARLGAVEGIVVEALQGGRTHIFIVNHALAPMDDPNVLAAIAASLDREEVVDRAFAGQWIPLYSPIPPGYLGANDTLFEDAFQSPNLELARELLAASGYSEDNPLELALWYPPAYYGDSVVNAIQIVKEQIEATGMVDVELNAMEWGTYVSSLISGEELTGGYVDWIPDFPDPDNFLTPFGMGAGLGSNTNSEELDALLARAATEMDIAVREELYGQIQDLWVELMPTIPLWFEPSFVLYREGVSGVEINAPLVFAFQTLSISR